MDNRQFAAIAGFVEGLRALQRQHEEIHLMLRCALETDRDVAVHQCTIWKNELAQASSLAESTSALISTQEATIIRLEQSQRGYREELTELGRRLTASMEEVGRLRGQVTRLETDLSRASQTRRPTDTQGRTEFERTHQPNDMGEAAVGKPIRRITSTADIAAANKVITRG